LHSQPPPSVCNLGESGAVFPSFHLEVGMAKLDPRVSEFESTEAADYDWWFRAKIERAMADTRPTISHDQVMARTRCDRSRREAIEAR